MAVRRMLIAGRYRLLEPVGSGGMGRVWMARDEMLDRDVAVKEFVPPDWMTDDEKNRLRDRTLREARSAARLNHPHVVRIYDVVHADGLPWIVMEYVASRSLHQVIAEDGPFDPVSAARIGLHVLDALTAAHRAGVLHRDVKPHNVLIGPDGRVVLTDFGLATFVDDGSVTGPGLVVGSPQYVSPERARDGASTVESDLWSLGATLYAAVEGRSPYARDSAMATLMALATEPPDAPVLAGPLAPVLTGLLQHEPASRLTAAEVEEQLRAVVAGTRTPRPASVAVHRPRVPAQRTPAEAGNGAQPRMSTLTDTPARTDPEPVGDRNASPVTVGEPTTPAVRRGNQGPAAAQLPISVNGSATPAATRKPTPPPVDPEPPAAPAPRRGRLLIAGILLVVSLAGAGIAAGYLRQGDDRPDAPGAAPMLSGTPATPSAAASATAAPAAAGFSPVVCDREPPANAARTPQRGAARDVNGWALAPGYSFWADPNGFHIGVPDGWTVERIGTTVCFRDPDNVRILSLDYGRNPKGDPVAACRTEAARLLRAGALRNYQQVGEIEPVKLLKKAADWEYRYTGANDVRMHAKTRWFANDGAAFALGWITRDFDWDPNQAAYSFIVSTFYRETPSGRRATPSR